MPDLALDIRDLRKSYNGTLAVDGLTLQVPRGAIFAVVGPNGAGKTTTIEIAEGLKTADAGSVHVLGLPMPDALDQVRRRVGVQLQSTALFERLTVRETIALYRSFYTAGADVDDVLERLHLAVKADARVEELSGGQQQRVALALALVNGPELLFLDEPTANLDPQARREVWKFVEDLRSRGCTVVYTTHYMDEAEKLSDEVAIIDHGRLVAQDSPAQLIRQLARSDVIEFTCDRPEQAAHFADLPATQTVTTDGAQVFAYAADVRQCLSAALDRAETVGTGLGDLRIRTASLEDVFIERTGHGLRE